jgi:hypothetical protein
MKLNFTFLIYQPSHGDADKANGAVLEEEDLAASDE